MIHFNRTNSNGCPCGKECPDRQVEPNCHGYCERYLKWRAGIDKLNDAERTRHKNNDTISEAKRRSLWKGKRYQRQVRYNKSTKAD